MLKTQVGDLHTIPVSHGEGPLCSPAELMAGLIANGQVATQYVDAAGKPLYGYQRQPQRLPRSGGGIFSPTAASLVRWATASGTASLSPKISPGNKHQPLFESGAEYFK